MPSSACDWSSDVCSSDRSEEHTSELQSRSDLVCRLLLEKKKNLIKKTSAVIRKVEDDVRHPPNESDIHRTRRTPLLELTPGLADHSVETTRRYEQRPDCD